MEFFECISIELKNGAACLLALSQCIIILANSEFSGRVFGDNMFVDAVEYKCQTGLGIFRLLSIRVDNKLLVATDDAMHRRYHHFHGQATVQQCQTSRIHRARNQLKNHKNLISIHVQVRIKYS